MWLKSPGVNKLKDGDTWHYLDPSGAMATGWQKIDGSWYHFNASGAMLSGWQKVGSTWYYLSSSGAMRTGWLAWRGQEYYLTGSGAMATGWKRIGSAWYLFDGFGAMLTGWQKVDGTWYYLSGYGAMQTGWLEQNGTWYWLDGSGAMATGWGKADGKWHWFTSSGAWTPGYHHVYADVSVDILTSGLDNLSDLAVEVAQATPFFGVGYCSELVTLVFRNLGFTKITADACDVYYMYANVGDAKANPSILKPGMIVAVLRVHDNGWGETYGHVGIYIGNGKVMHNYRWKETWDLDRWLNKFSYYQDVWCGWMFNVDLS